MFVGMFFGDVLGVVTGVDSNVGGVGFAMLLLILASDWMLKKGKMSEKAQSGIQFWSAMYIPVVVAMTACQNVVAALSAGPMALVAGVGITVLMLALVPLLQKIGKPSDPLPPIESA